MDRRTLLTAALALGAAPAWARPGRRVGDLTGVWTNAWYTSLETRPSFKGPVATPEEAEAFEAPRRALHGERPSKPDEIGQNESEFSDQGPGLARIRGQIRDAWITDPPDGKVPWIKDMPEKIGLLADEPNDNPEQRHTEEQCLTFPGDAAPILNAHDANLIQIVQTGEHVAILSEKGHSTRIVRLDGPAAAAGEPGRWTGDSVGRWEGRTLVVETRHGRRPGLTRVSDYLMLSEQARVTERITRTGPNEITYLFEVEDPTLFTRVWRGEQLWRPAEGLLYEYACHEGNYGLPDIMRIARRAESKAAAAAAGK